MRLTVRAAVLGHPIGHSKSPALHGAAYGKLGVDIEYSAIDLTVEQLPAFMAAVRAEPNWCGLSVTMPLKSAMVTEVDEVRGAAAHLGVVNTVAFERTSSEGGAGTRGAGTRGTGDLRTVGYNTDVAGIVEAVRYAGVASEPSAAILGGGGTSAAAIAALVELGAARAAVFVRDASRASEAKAAGAAVGLPIDILPLSGAAGTIAASQLVISTLPPHAADGIAAELAEVPAVDSLPQAGVLLDVAYDPWPSRIATAWQERGGVVVPGLEMLLYQAVGQVRLFSGLDRDVTPEVIDVMCDSVGLPRRVL
ncbi:shikimate dehydrogenase [Arthrobacter sp. ISL-30]|nr:shikimate dehydrogenase [Arthrobacter sp. ISL-30]